MSLFAVTDPATGVVVKEFDPISNTDLQDAIGRADDVYRSWLLAGSIRQRADWVRRVGELHVERREQLAEIVTRETGKPHAKALEEIDFCCSVYAFYADNGEELLADEPVKLTSVSGSAVVRNSPLGVLIGIMPWNYPYYQVARFAGPNLVAGNTVLLKHAPQCPESAAAIEQIFRDAGFPEGAYINIYATNEQVETVIADQRVRGVSLTGSERAGSAVAEIAGRHLKKVVLELGGSDPFILLSTDDLDGAVHHAVHLRLENTGQACNGGKRFLIIDELYEPFLEKFTAELAAVRPADPKQPDTEIGPLSSTAAADRLEDQVRRAVDQGATVALGGMRDGNFFEPTILTGVASTSDVYREELFGPVAQVFCVADEQEAVRIANDTPYGLGSYLLSTDAEQVQRVANQIDAGMVFVNDSPGGGVELPFGGIKNSGFGRECGSFGINEFVNKKLIHIGS